MTGKRQNRSARGARASVERVELKPIDDQKQHRAALREIERLWASQPGTADHDRLEVLATLVADYEDRNEPIQSPAAARVTRAS